MEKLLIVEDDLQVRVLMMRWLMSAGYSVAAAGTATEALDELNRQPVALALCDVGLPGRDGLWLAGEIHRRFPQTVLVMATGSRDFHSVVGSLRHGAVDYLYKPIARDELIDAVKRGLEHYREAVEQRERLACMELELRAKEAAIIETTTDARISTGTAIDGMLAMLEAHAPGSRAHSQRVARLTADTALLMGVSNPLLSQIENAALLHDLGRIAMPDVLTASGDRVETFGPERRRLVPELGAALLRNVSFLARASEIVLGLAEHFDGSGSPSGLHGRQIPLGARVIALTDEYDRLTEPGDSNAGPLFTPEAAFDELQQLAGARFDPEVLAAVRLAASLASATAAD